MKLNNVILAISILFSIFLLSIPCESPVCSPDFHYLFRPERTITARDVTSASLYSVKKACLHTQYSEYETIESIHENIPFMIESSLAVAPESGINTIGFTTVDVPDAAAYKEWEKTTIPMNYSAPLWYFDDSSHEFWGNGDGQFQPWETHEEIQVRFDGIETHEGECLPALQGGNTHMTLNFDPASTRYSWYTLPGLIYRADNIFVPPMAQCMTLYTPFEIDFTLDVHNVFIPDPIMVLHGGLPCFSLFDTAYSVVDAGPVLDINKKMGEKGPRHGTPYLVTGNPHLEKDFYIWEGESIQIKEYIIELLDSDFMNGKATLKVYKNNTYIDTVTLSDDQWSCGFNEIGPHCISEGLSPLLSVDAYHGTLRAGRIRRIFWKDKNMNERLDPKEYESVTNYDFNGDNIPDFQKWIMYTTTKNIWAHSEWETYEDNQGDSWLLFNTVDIAIDYYCGIISFNERVGVNLLIYWLEDTKIWLNTLCCNPWNTYSEGGDFRIFIDAYQTGWDVTEDNAYAFQPPGTGLWPPAGLETWEHAGMGTFVGNGFLDCNDGHCGYECALLPDGYVLEIQELDRDCHYTNDCRSQDWTLLDNCTDIYDIEDPGIVYGPGLIMLEINIFLYGPIRYSRVYPWIIQGPSVNKSPFFTVQVTEIKRDSITYIVILDDIDGN